MNILFVAAQILFIILLGTDIDLTAVFSALAFLGLWKVFRKCGIKGWWVLVPGARKIQLGRCADRESEGRMAGVLELLIIAGRIPLLFISSSSTPGTILSVALTFLALVEFIYHIRIFLGLIEVFDQKRAWILVWAISPLRMIPALMWGFMKEYRPLWTVEEIESDAGSYFSGARAVVLDQGLTVNLEERTAMEMFKKKHLLRDIHMYIQPGRMVLLLGGSGAGKTTFLNAVNGYEKARAEVVLNGRNMYSDYKDMKYDIGFVPQQDLVRGSDSVFRTLMDAAKMRLPADFSKAERQARVEEVMDIFGLTPLKNSLVVKLSGGQRKRLSIAMEFVSNPALFILDEPDSGLDGVMARELFQQLREIADQGKIIIVITHTPDRVIDMFDDVIVLAKDAHRTGRLAFFGTIGEARAFFGKEKMEDIVKAVNREEEGGEGRADEFILKYAEVQHV